MLNYILRRIFYMIILLALVSFVSFVIIQLPPGDYLTTMIQNMRARGMIVDMDSIQNMEERYGLNLPVYQQYFKWIWNFVRGDMGHSLQWNAPVAQLIGERFVLPGGVPKHGLRLHQTVLLLPWLLL